MPLKIVLISDTHGLHDQINVPNGDILIHAGDMSMQGGTSEISRFSTWLARQPHEDKIVIAGNHDFGLENSYRKACEEMIRLAGAIYLNDSGVRINGLNFYGSPVQPWFYDWAFNRQRGAEIKRHWDMIPTDTDVLITHGPPFGIGDQSDPRSYSDHLGCDDLFERVGQLPNLKLHVFGHIHGGAGIYNDSVSYAKFVNASVLNEMYKPNNREYVVEV